MKLDDSAYLHILSRPAGSPLSNYYELLGVAQGEADPAALEQAMLDCVIKVRRYQVGAYQTQALALLNELGQAYVCLTDDDARQQYERSLGIENSNSPLAAEPDAAVESQQAWPVEAEPLPRRTREPKPAAEPTQPHEEAPAAQADTCPQCNKPMSPRLTTCYHCNYRRAPTDGGADRQQNASAALISMLSNNMVGDDDLVRQDVTPEQLLARLNLMRDMYQAKTRVRLHWVSTQPNQCQHCTRKLSGPNDAYALSVTMLSRNTEFVTMFARRLQAMGRRYEWPLSGPALSEVQKAIVGRNPQAVRLFCRGCAERMLRSPKA